MIDFFRSESIPPASPKIESEVRRGAIDKIGGSDEVWYDNKSGYYYLAAAKNPGGPVLGVIDARTDRWIANLPSGPRAHSVAADPKTGRVFVPIEARKDSADCASGCVAVYASKAE